MLVHFLVCWQPYGLPMPEGACHWGSPSVCIRHLGLFSKGRGMAGAMFAWGHNGKEGVKDCFPQSSFLIARARGSLGFLLPERRQNSAFYISVESQGLLLTDGKDVVASP